MDTGQGSGQPPPQQVPTAQGQRTLLLVADDDLDILQLLKELLEDEGYEVLTATNGMRALEIAQQAALALVLTDYMMPRLNGIQLRQHLLANPATAALPVILLSAAPPPDNEELFTAVIHKPFLFDEILEQVQRHSRM